MHRIAQFFAISAAQLAADWRKSGLTDPAPEALPLPKRATGGSAGYDFFSPVDFTLQPSETILLPTGVRVRIDEGWVLLLMPRSSLGFKYRLQLANTVGVIDSDYFGADNEGHIHLKLTNDSREGRVLTIRRGEAIAQGIFVPYGITVDDETTEKRFGGFGSTNRTPQKEG
ncbi:MAG: dUTP diphosphatase [Clostridia bacterium]|nr:dUTP diphosphatase [Clostridia bacterium]